MDCMEDSSCTHFLRVDMDEAVSQVYAAWVAVCEFHDDDRRIVPEKSAETQRECH